MSDQAKSLMLNSIDINKVSVHEGDPGLDGVSNELLVTRQTCSFSPATTGSRVLDNDVVFTIPAGKTVTYIGYWDDGQFLISQSIDGLSYSAAGKLILNAISTEVAL
ncbi:hypothetical protein K2227_03835 [Shewanella putrefaciens]|nr:hypothetical protein K2227_03835 [Shewanella putrefaciens]